MDIVATIADLDATPELHTARLLVLLSTFAGDDGSDTMEGLTKLAKLDFLLRYPVMLERALDDIALYDRALSASEIQGLAAGVGGGGDAAGAARYLASGDIEFVNIGDDNVVNVRLQGACSGCAAAQMTLKNGVEARIRQEIPEIAAVEAVGEADHGADRTCSIRTGDQSMP